MITQIKSDIYCTHGDTFKLPFFSDMTFLNEDTLRMQIADQYTGNIFIDKTYTLDSDGKFYVVLTAKDREKINIGDYVYRVSVVNANGDITTRLSGNFYVEWGTKNPEDAGMYLYISPKALVNKLNELDNKADKPVIVVASDMKPHPNGLAGLFTVSLDKTYNEIIALFESGEELYILLNTDGGAERLKFETITESGRLLFGECFGDSYIRAEIYSNGYCNVMFYTFYTASAINNMIGDIEPALDSIIAIQNTLIGGGTT